jgi:hypothetical protein
MRLGLKMLLLIGREQQEHGRVSCGQIGEWEGDTQEPHPIEDRADSGLSTSADGRQNVRPSQDIPCGYGALPDCELAHLGTVLGSNPFGGRFRW